MSSVKTNDKFETTLLDEIAEIIKRDYSDPKKRKFFRKTLKNELFGKKEKISFPGEAFSKKEVFLYDIFKIYFEIRKSLESMEMAAAFIRRSPNYGSKKVNKAAYLRYHIESYLGEMYVFKNRLEKFFNQFIKEAKKAGLKDRQEETSRLKNKLLGILNQSAEIRQRGSHIHIRRYSDDDLEKLESLDLFASFKKSRKNINKTFRALELYRDLEFKRTRKAWIKKINTNNRIVREEIIDRVFEKIKPTFLELLKIYTE